MNKKALSLAVYIAISYPSATLALGLGEIESVSSLNQPFKAKIDLLSVGNTNVGSLKVKVASPSVFSRVGIERPNFLNGLRFRSAVENGKPVILVSSSQPVKEPFINFLLEVSWPKGQLLKEYTVLLDPPVLMQPGTSIASNTVGVRPDPSAARSQAQRQQQQNAANQQVRQQQQRQRVIAQQKQAQQQRQTQQQQQRQRQLQQQRQQAQNDGLRRPGAPTGATAASNAGANRAKTYRIRRGDTLFKVAKKLGYNGVRNEQMMMAIYEANPTAFRKRNINNLKSGVSVRRPSINEAKRVSLQSARQDIRSQTSDWKRSRSQKPASTNASQNKNNVSGKVAGNAVAGNSQARIEVLGSTNGKNSASSGNLVGQAKLDDLNRQMTLASESLTARTRENNDLKSRVSELEALLKKKNRLITLKNEQLAELQVSLGKPPTAMGATDTDIVGTVNEQGGDIEKMITGQDGNDGTIVRTQDPAEAIISDMGQDTEIFQEPVNDATTTALNTQEPVEEEGGILGLLSSPLVMGLGGGSLLALIAGFLFLRRRNNSDEYDEGYSPIDFDDPSFAPGSNDFDDIPQKAAPMSDADDPFAGLGGSSSPVESGFDVDPMDEMIGEEIPDATPPHSAVVPPMAASNASDVDDDDDILQEADVYIVYGLHEQAEVELKKAIEKQPDNLEYRAKLLENYHASDNKEAFEAEAAVFSQLNGPGKAELWEKVSGWGGKLLPASPLFASGVAAVASSANAKAAETTIANTQQAAKDGASGGLAKLGAAAAAGGVAITAGKAFADNAQSKLSDSAANANNSVGSAVAGLTENMANVSNEPSAGAADNAEVLDFDDMDLDSLLSADDKVDSSDAKAAQSIDVESGFEDLDFAIQDIEVDTKHPEPAETTQLDGGEMDFDFSEFEIDEAPSTEQSSSVTAAKTDDFDGLDDFSDLGFDLDEPEDKTRDATSLNLALDGSNTGVGKILPENSVYKISDAKESTGDVLSGMDDDLSFLDLDGAGTELAENQVSTKLDLARAYMDMGDVEGARSTLEEVMAEGNDSQKQEAKELLHQAG